VPFTYSRYFSSSPTNNATSTHNSTKIIETKSSVSSDEVSKFSSMAGTWWKVKHNPLISMNPVRMSFITDQIMKHCSLPDHRRRDIKSYEPYKGLRALDIGCGGGLLSESLARLGASVTAIDPSEGVAKAAEMHSKQNEKTKTIEYKGGISAEELASREEYKESFDMVCVLEVIEHATDPRSLMKAAISLLKKPKGDDPGGMLFVSTINRTAKSFGVAILGAEYVTGKVPIGTHNWSQFMSPEEVETLVRDFGLVENEKMGMVLRPPFYDLNWYLNENDFDVNWIGSYRYERDKC
jgi:ubiquinone biosynthesis O-methyltransferase